MGSSNEKIWLEGLETGKAKKDKFTKLDFAFNKNEQETIHSFVKQKKLRLEVLMKACWGLLLTRLSSHDSLLIGATTPALLSKNKHKLYEAFQPIKVKLDHKMTVKSYLNKIQSQIAKKNTLTKKVPDALRYLLICKGKGKASNFLMQLKPDEFPLILFTDTDNCAKQAIIYNESIFGKNTINNIANYFKVLIIQMCSKYNEKATLINILPESEKNKILNNFNNQKFDFTVPSFNLTFHELFARKVTQQPEHIALSDGKHQISYKDLDNASTNLAEQLIANGVNPGDRVCVYMERSPTWIMSMLAIFKASAIYIPINPKFPSERIKFVIDDCQPQCILASSSHHLPFPKSANVFVINSDWENTQLISDKTINRLPEPTLDAIAYVIYTSGTTGTPKGVMIKHESITNLIAWYQGAFQVSSKDRVSQFGSQGFDSHLCEILPALALGASIHIVDDNTKLTPSLFFEWLKNEKITICDLTTAYAQLLFVMHWPENLALRLMKIGGESLAHYPSSEMQFDVWNIYGPTETTIETTFMKIHSNEMKEHGKNASIPPIGKPITGSKVYIVDQNLQPVPIGVGGELLIGGTVVSAGYINNEQLTKEKFISNPFNNGDNRPLYRTGDVVRWLPDGNLEFVGRIDNQIKLRGYRIELNDIEHAITQAPDVNEVVVLLKENVHKEKSLVAYVVPNFDKQRYLYQQRCLISTDNMHFFEGVSEDISKNGLSIFGINKQLSPGQKINIQLKLPGFSDSKILYGNVVWQEGNRCGIVFDMPDDEMQLVQKSIDYHLSSNNVMELVLSASAKRSLRKALQKRVPDYMIPSVFVTMMNFPLNLSGKIDLKALPPPQNFEQLIHREFIAAKTPTERKLAAMWSELLHKDKISMNDNFFDLGGTSLTAADLSVRILTEFKTSVPAKILFDLSYIPILAEYIDSNGLNYQQQPFMHDELMRDCLLTSSLEPTKNIHTSSTNPKNILLTGAGGFLGVYLLRDLLQKTDAKIYCLIRKGEFETAAKRLIETVRKFKLEQDVSLNDRRIIAIASDISFDNFGLPLEQYNSLLDKIDLIYHCGAQVNIMASYNKLRASNVVGTLEVIKFATQHYDKPIHYISTLSSAYLKNEKDELAEEFPDENYTELFGGYAISKWVSERMLTNIKKNGLPVSIYRSGYISGDSSTGITNTNDALLLLIKGCIQLGFAPQFNEKITILPVDFVSRAIVNISLHNPDHSSVYHVDHPTGILWTDLVQWLIKFGYRVELIPMQKWREKLVTIDKTNALYPFLPYYLALPNNHVSPDVEVTNTKIALETLNVPFPNIDNKLLSVYFDYLISVEFLPPPISIRQPTV